MKLGSPWVGLLADSETGSHIFQVALELSIYLFSYLLLLFYADECFAYMSVCAPCECLVAKKPEQGVGSPGTRVNDSYELL